ncbi:hypothetical protein RND71_037436 [Anisodus tanguticus]|uniref:Uncharacterized protein n=1 Tax=Anisodus tanguticus TaxID=243964 RepID=A0AAE1R5X2_9SOLA|nr:hypothetical protein RND71_037436 [Anisodus tanguticus]
MVGSHERQKRDCGAVVRNLKIHKKSSLHKWCRRFNDGKEELWEKVAIVKYGMESP